MKEVPRCLVWKRAICATLLFACACRCLAQELIVNGSFENTGGTFVNDGQGLASLPAGSTTIPGWTTITAELAWVNNTNTFGAATPYGAFSLELTGYHDGRPYGGVTQTIATTPGQTYRLSLALGSNADFPSAGGQKSVSVCVDSTGTVLTFMPTNTTGNQWATFSFDFTAGSTSTVITIAGIISGGGNYLGLDNVSVTSVVPPPALTNELVANGSFENFACPLVTDANSVISLPPGSTNIPGWTVTGAELLWGLNGNLFGTRTPHGSFFIDLTGYHDSLPYAGVSQTIATSPGQNYRLSFSIGADQDFPAYSGPMTVAVTAGSVSNSFTFTPAGAGNQWAAFTLDFTAGAATTALSFTGTGSAGGQYLGLDDISAVPLPPLLITAAEKFNNDLRLSFNSLNGKSYAIQSRTGLVSGAWVTLPGTTNSGTGGTAQATVTNAFFTSQQFYRVWQLP